MKKLSLVFLILAISTSLANAHNGTIGLYTDETISDCDLTLTPYAPTDITIMYVKSDGGPDGINGVEFMIENSDPVLIQILSATWAPNTIPMGDISTGFSMVWTGVDCIGAGESMVFIGTLQIMSSMAPEGWTFHVLPNPDSLDPSSVWVSICDEFKSMQAVLGGWFHGQEGACNMGAEASSWGAIKNMYIN